MKTKYVVKLLNNIVSCWDTVMGTVSRKIFRPSGFSSEFIVFRFCISRHFDGGNGLLFPETPTQTHVYALRRDGRDVHNNFHIAGTYCVPGTVLIAPLNVLTQHSS